MKILHVITSLSIGGAEHLLVDLLPRIKNYGIEVELAVFNSKRTSFYDQLEESGIKIHGFSETEGVYNLRHILRLRKLMRKFDIVHTHNTACQMFATLVKRRNNILVTTEHSTSTRRRNYPFFRLIDRLMYSKYDKIICISRPSEISLRHYIGNDYPIVTILNGIDVNKFLNAPKIDLGFSQCKLITMVAGFRYEKDQATLVRALKHLPDIFHVLLVGDGEKRTEIESLIHQLNLTTRVHLLGIRNDVSSVLKSSDIIVMSSHREGLSLSNVEGMASGNPFVASDVEGLREVTKGYGVLFPHGDEKYLAEVILKLDMDETYRTKVIDKCLERARHYDINVMAQNYYKQYLQLASNTNRI